MCSSGEFHYFIIFSTFGAVLGIWAEFRSFLFLFKFVAILRSAGVEHGGKKVWATQDRAPVERIFVTASKISLKIFGRFRMLST